jgi:uncharacterized protein (TIRG00374 family)
MKRWQLALGIVVSAVFLYFALKGLDLPSVWNAIRGANYAWIVPGVIVYFGAVWARAWRWRFLLRPLKDVRLRDLFPVVVIGYKGNNVFPYRAGEVIRAYILRRNQDVSISASLATIIVERTFDGLTMLIFVFAALPFVPLPDALRLTVVLATVAFFGALVVFFALALSPRRAERVYTWFITRLLPERLHEKTLGFAARFMDGLASLRSPRDLLMTFVSSLAIWLTETTKYWFVMHAFDFSVSFFALMLMTAVVNLATTLPSTPGYIGTFDEPGIEILKLFNVPADVAAGYTLVLHAALWLPITLLGFWFMGRQGIRWSDFGRALQTAQVQDTPGAVEA